jgi:hypothetical protein
MRILFLGFFLIGTLAASVAEANILDVSYIGTFEGQNNGGAANVNIRQYSSTIPTGGGQFVIGVGGAKTTCTPDHGVVLQDVDNAGHAQNCYYRQFSGPVHLSWYGAVDAADPVVDCYDHSFASCDSKGKLTSAFAAAAVSAGFGGDGGVVTDGRSIYIDGNVDIPSNQYLSCNGPPGASRDQGGTTPEYYWTLPNSIILSLNHHIHREENTRLSDCILRPSWYVPTTTTNLTIPPTNVQQTVQMMHQFSGTATTCDGESCNMDNMLIIGFDTCDETTKQRSILSNLLEECLVNEWIHNNGGGMKLQNVIVKQYIEGSLSTGLDHATWPITAVRQDTGTDRIIATIYAPSSNPNGLDTTNFGDTVLISGMGESHVVNSTGTLTGGDQAITEVPAAGASKIGIGDVVQDGGTSGCVPANTFVESADAADDGTYTVTASNPMSCSAANEALTFAHFLAPAGGNGRWLTANVSSAGTDLWDVTLTGASWAGPTTDANTVTWKIGSSAIGVMDTTNIVLGQYVCTALSPPFCTPPSGFAASYVLTNISTIGTSTGTINVTGGPSPGVVVWPVSGLVRVGFEDMSYTVLSSSTMSITGRGLNGTGVTTHMDIDHVIPAAPVVVGLAPTSKAVIVSAAAQGSCTSTCGTITFANDTRLSAGGYVGQLTLNPGYHTWTANTAAGGAPSAALVAIAAAGSGSSLSISKSCWKVQKGMRVSDLTNNNSIGAGITISSITSCSSATGAGVFALSGSIATVTGDHIQFTGCGMPDSTHPWLGNCVSTSLLAGGGNDLAQGVVCEYFHSFGNQIQIHTIDAPATSCTNSVLAGGGGLGDQIDPDSVALWLDGDATNTQFTNGRIAGATTSILDTPDRNGNGGGQAAGVGLSNIQIPGNVILGPDSNALLTGVHGHPSGAQSNPFIYAASAMLSTEISGSYLSQWPVYFDDVAVYAKMYCTGNSFATPLCSQVKTTPACVSSCTSVSGSDSDFDIAVSGTNTSVTVLLSSNYVSKPICRATASATGGGAAASASIVSVTTQPLGTTVVLKKSAAVPHIYGSCHSATG